MPSTDTYSPPDRKRKLDHRSNPNGTRLAATSIREKSWDGIMESINLTYTYKIIIVFATPP
jgi:hypothetical protein